MRDGSIAHVVVLAIATVLSVFKPWGSTPWTRLIGATGSSGIAARSAASNFCFSAGSSTWNRSLQWIVAAISCPMHWAWSGVGP